VDACAIAIAGTRLDGRKSGEARETRLYTGLFRWAAPACDAAYIRKGTVWGWGVVGPFASPHDRLQRPRGGLGIFGASAKID